MSGHEFARVIFLLEHHGNGFFLFLGTFVSVPAPLYLIFQKPLFLLAHPILYRMSHAVFAFPKLRHLTHKLWAKANSVNKRFDRLMEKIERLDSQPKAPNIKQDKKAA